MQLNGFEQIAALEVSAAHRNSSTHVESCRFSTMSFSGGSWCLRGFAIDSKWLWASNGRILNSLRAKWVHDFAIVSDGLMLFPEGPRALRECPGGLGAPWKCGRWWDPVRVSCPCLEGSWDPFRVSEWSGPVWACRNLSQLVATPVALRDLPWGPIHIYI